MTTHHQGVQQKKKELAAGIEHEALKLRMSHKLICLIYICMASQYRNIYNFKINSQRLFFVKILSLDTLNVIL